MPSIDMPLEKLREYKPGLYREKDFEAFWKRTVDEAKQQPLAVELVPYNLPTRNLECFSLRFDGFKGGRLGGWYLKPKKNGKHPGLCMYHGYSLRGARPLDMLPFAEQGMCVLSMDTRGQNGLSQDAATYSDGHHSGWMTQGIRSPEEYYFRQVYADAVRALELLASFEEVDIKRIAVTGGSQGGGLSLAAAALSERPILCLADIPFLCDFRRGVEICPAGPYPEIASFLKAFPHLREQVIRTVSYCDNLNLAPWIKCRTVISNCLWDDVCPPSTIFAAYNHISAEKHMEIYPYHKHEIPYEHNEFKFRELMKAF
ncbi:MAG TPA: acetylxylan esterase [Tepidisphaeraceae bacterium]|jgi:cephalosporin-C deacetylase